MGGNSQVGVYKEGGGESQVSQCKEHGQQAPQGREDSQDEVAKERSSSQASCCQDHGQEARQEDVISQDRKNKEGGTSQAKLYLSQGEDQEQRGTECTEEAEPVLALPARNGGKSSQASGLGRESTNLGTKYPDVSEGGPGKKVSVAPLSVKKHEYYEPIVCLENVNVSTVCKYMKKCGLSVAQPCTDNGWMENGYKWWPECGTAQCRC